MDETESAAGYVVPAFLLEQLALRCFYTGLEVVGETGFFVYSGFGLDSR